MWFLDEENDAEPRICIDGRLMAQACLYQTLVLDLNIQNGDVSKKHIFGLPTLTQTGVIVLYSLPNVLTTSMDSHVFLCYTKGMLYKDKRHTHTHTHRDSGVVLTQVGLDLGRLVITR